MFLRLRNSSRARVRLGDAAIAGGAAAAIDEDAEETDTSRRVTSG
jgi:hypothetical protein